MTFQLKMMFSILYQSKKPTTDMVNTLRTSEPATFLCFEYYQMVRDCVLSWRNMLIVNDFRRGERTDLNLIFVLGTTFHRYVINFLIVLKINADIQFSSTRWTAESNLLLENMDLSTFFITRLGNYNF